MWWISFDSANKSLSVAVVFYDEVTAAIQRRLWEIFFEKLKNGEMRGRPKLVDSYMEALDILHTEKTSIHYMETVDLLEGRSLREVPMFKRLQDLSTWLSRLHNRLTELGVDLADSTVLMEDQMKDNDKSRITSFNVLFYFAEHGATMGELIKGHHKNTCKKTLLNKGKNRYNTDWPEISDFKAKYASSYYANKSHTKACLDFWVRNFANEKEKALLKSVSDTGVKLDDIADALFQCVAAIGQKYSPLIKE